MSPNSCPLHGRRVISLILSSRVENSCFPTIPPVFLWKSILAPQKRCELASFSPRHAYSSRPVVLPSIPSRGLASAIHSWSLPRMRVAACPACHVGVFRGLSGGKRCCFFAGQRACVAELASSSFPSRTSRGPCSSVVWVVANR